MFRYINTFILKLRRRETPFYQRLYRVLKKLRGISFPCIPVFHRCLFYAHRIVMRLWFTLKEKLFLTPTFKSRLVSCGSGLRVCHDMPFVPSDNLVLHVGNNVTFVGQISLSGGKTFSHPYILIGDDSTIGWGLSVNCARRIVIGYRCKIANNVYIADNNSHPVDPARRSEPLQINEVEDVVIGNDVWLCTGAKVLKGSIIGDGSVIGADCVVSGLNIPPNSMVFGNPAIVKPIKVKDQAE